MNGTLAEERKRAFAPALSRRGWALLITAFLLSLIATLPLRAAAGLMALGDMGVAARSLRGPVWWGAAEDLQLGGTRIGTVDVMLRPLSLLTGQVRFDLSRQRGEPTDLAGAITIGIGTRGIDDLTGTVPVGRSLAPLPITALSLQDVSIVFAGARCVHAEGRVQAMLSGGMGGVVLSNGLSGAVRCDGADLALMLVGQSGTERIDIRIASDGRYRAEMALGGNPANAAALMASGFQTVGDRRILRVQGRL